MAVIPSFSLSSPVDELSPATPAFSPLYSQIKALILQSAPHSATAQFFINTTNNGFLDFKSESAQGWGYAVFGRVVAGSEVVDAIEGVRTGRKGGHDDVPLEDVLIQRVVVV